MVVNAGDELAEKANHAEVNYNQSIADRDENEVSAEAHTPLTLYNEKRNHIWKISRFFLTRLSTSEYF